MTSGFIALEINRTSSIVADDCSCLFAGFAKSFFCIINDQFFAEGIDEMFGAAGNLYAVNFMVSPIM
jgi:hypothetical protein